MFTCVGDQENQKGHEQANIEHRHGHVSTSYDNHGCGKGSERGFGRGNLVRDITI